MTKCARNLKIGSQMGHKTSKGAVSITEYKGRIRLRWRYNSKRYSLNHLSFTKNNLKHAQKVALQIENDILFERFDFTLERYGKEETKKPITSSVVAQFEEWTQVYKQRDCEKHIDYNSVRNMLRKWKQVNQSNILTKLNTETFCPGTYNRRLNMLKGFIKWLVKSGAWQINPLEDVNPKRIKKVKQAQRKPFTEEEIRRILHAFKNDTFCPKCSSFKHSHYYPFIYFIFKTGVRNAEAIGLRAGSIDTDAKTITIKEVLARSLKGTNAAQRIRKETKNGKIRQLPLTADLLTVLLPVIAEKGNDELVFQSVTGLAIDDHNFQRRIFRKVLEKLGIENRVLYACRHTFASRCIASGITPITTAFLLGNNPETALRNYTHLLEVPKDIPLL